MYEFLLAHLHARLYLFLFLFHTCTNSHVFIWDKWTLNLMGKKKQMFFNFPLQNHILYWVILWIYSQWRDVTTLTHEGGWEKLERKTQTRQREVIQKAAIGEAWQMGSTVLEGSGRKADCLTGRDSPQLEHRTHHLEFFKSAFPRWSDSQSVSGDEKGVIV